MDAASLPPKPLPALGDLVRPFWEAAGQGRLVLQRCARCGTFQFHPKPWCIECACRELPWTDVPRTGTVYSHTVSTSVAMNYPGWQDELPVVLCLVDLDVGARMYAQLTGCEPDAVAIGLRVEAWFAPIGEGIGIPKFRPFAEAR